MSVDLAYIVPHPPLIVPEVGRGQERGIKATIDAYERAAQDIADYAPQTIVVVTPHSTVYQDYIHISPGKSARGDLGQFGAGDVCMKKVYDTAFGEALSDTAFAAGIPAGMMGERDKALDHATMVPLYFIDKYYTDYQLLRVSVAGLALYDHYRFGQCVAKAAKQLERRTVFIASGDLSHRLTTDGPYGFAPQGPVFDERITAFMRRADFLGMMQMDNALCEAAGECGLRPIVIMAGVLDRRAVDTVFRSYEGPFGVGYAVCGYRVTRTDENRNFADKYIELQNAALKDIKYGEDEYVRLARQSLETYVKTRRHMPRPDVVPKGMGHRAGVFVSLKKDGRLRGCIGTIMPTTHSIADEIIRNAISAGTGDPRFDPVTEDELSALVYSVDVLSPPEPVASMDELDTERYGVIVSSGMRRGLLLPNLDGVDTPQKQVEIALRKAGIAPGEDYTMERFEVVRHT